MILALCFERFSLDLFSLFKNGFVASSVGADRFDVTQAFVVTLAVMMIYKGSRIIQFRLIEKKIHKIIFFKSTLQSHLI